MNYMLHVYMGEGMEQVDKLEQVIIDGTSETGLLKSVRSNIASTVAQKTVSMFPDFKIIAL